MMKFAAPIIALLFLVGACSGIAFDHHGLFGVRVRGGSKKQDAAIEHDATRAEHSIRHSIELVERKIHQAVQAEVDTLFSSPAAATSSPKTKQQLSTKAKAAVEKGAKRVKEQVPERSQLHRYPYQWPTTKTGGRPTEPHTPDFSLHKDFHLLHAMETAEQAVLHAVQEEVDTLFPPPHKEEEEARHEKGSHGADSSSSPSARSVVQSLRPNKTCKRRIIIDASGS